MRTSRPARDARAPNQSSGLACADQGHPRAALDANDLWIPGLGAQHPGVPLTCAPLPPSPPLSASGDSDADTVCGVRDHSAPRFAPPPPATSAAKPHAANLL